MASSDSHGESVMLLASAYIIFSYNVGCLILTNNDPRQGEIRQRQRT